MTENTPRRLRALALAGSLVAWSFTAGLKHPWRHHPVVQAALGTGLSVMTHAPLGLGPQPLRSGLRLGGAVVGVVAVAVAAATVVPRVRTAMLDRPLPEDLGRWLVLEIPLGTVWSEETAFRGALSTVATDAFGPVGGRLLQSLAFGLSHIPDARATGEPVVGTVAVTTLAGWLFGWLAQRSGSIAAPVLAHLAINESGALAALMAQRRSVSGARAAVAGYDGNAGR